MIKYIGHDLNKWYPENFHNWELDGSAFKFGVGLTIQQQEQPSFSPYSEAIRTCTCQPYFLWSDTVARETTSFIQAQGSCFFLETNSGLVARFLIPKSRTLLQPFFFFLTVSLSWEETDSKNILICYLQSKVEAIRWIKSRNGVGEDRHCVDTEKHC